MGLNQTIDDLATGVYTVTRQTSGTYDAGGYLVAGGTSSFSITAVVEPYGMGRQMLPLPEGVRAQDVRMVMAATPLRTADNNGAADVITIAGESFVCWAVEGPWTVDGDTHYEAYAARRGRP